MFQPFTQDKEKKTVIMTYIRIVRNGSRGLELALTILWNNVFLWKIFVRSLLGGKLLCQYDSWQLFLVSVFNCSTIQFIIFCIGIKFCIVLGLKGSSSNISCELYSQGHVEFLECLKLKWNNIFVFNLLFSENSGATWFRWFLFLISCSDKLWFSINFFYLFYICFLACSLCTLLSLRSYIIQMV